MIQENNNKKINPILLKKIDLYYVFILEKNILF